jgi:hypothetical protein
VFDFSKLRNVVFPDVETPGDLPWEGFTDYMMTDGVGCSFIFWEAKREAAKKLTPMDVKLDPEKNMVFRAIDPGMTNVVTGVPFEIVWREDATMPDGGEWMLKLSDDRKSVFSISAKEWHDMSCNTICFYSLLKQLFDCLFCEGSSQRCPETPQMAP